MSMILRKMSFPCRDEAEAITLGIELILNGISADIPLIPDPVFEYKNGLVILNVSLHLTEEQDAMFREIQQLVEEMMSTEVPVTVTSLH